MLLIFYVAVVKCHLDIIYLYLPLCRYYLPTLLLNIYPKNFEKKTNPDCKLVYNENLFIEKEGQMEFWWSASISTLAMVKNSNLDLLIWCRHTKTCKIIEFSCPADVNVTKKMQEKKVIVKPSYA